MVKIKLGPVRAPGEVPIRLGLVKAPGEVPIRPDMPVRAPIDTPIMPLGPVRATEKKTFAQKVKGAFTTKSKSKPRRIQTTTPKQTPTTQTPRGFNLLSFDINPRRKKQRRLRLNDII